ncbi:MAG TPA: hypothetical protein VJP76_08265 [Candidatus Tumulicola sp.]|nr:hypothetical protein [Candidatus Tumulicola sp.]
MWSSIGIALAVALAAIAWRRSRVPGGYYDAGVYAMTARIHRAYAIAGLAFALFFSAALALHRDGAGIAGLAAYAVVAIFYATSFLQGASDDDR